MMAASLQLLCLSVLLLGARCVLALEGHSQPRFAETALMLHGDGADARRAAVKNAAAALTPAQLSGSFAATQKMLVGACGMRWLPTADVGKGRNSHCFADFNHVACCVMPDGSQDKENQGQVQGIAIGNQLGEGIRAASSPALPAGGSWCTCALSVPQDVCHAQFHAYTGFYLVWCPQKDFKTFVLVDDAGKLLTCGAPSAALPAYSERSRGYMMFEGTPLAAGCAAADHAACQSAAASTTDVNILVG